MKILIIEDSAIQALVLETQLKKIGFRNTSMALNALAAHEAINSFKPDLLLVDINLGFGESGIDVVNKAKQNRSLFVIYITGNSDEKNLEAAKKSGSNGFLTKPIHFDELEHLITNLPVN